MPEYQSVESGYHNMWNKMEIKPEKASQVEKNATKIVDNWSTYQQISDDLGGRLPPELIGALHYRESSFDLKAHLHNGDPLTARTRQVPAGRPKSGTPPFTFRQSADDALGEPPHSLGKITVWSIERQLYEAEKYNGWGYLSKGNSPYVWSGTTLYGGGKYVADHEYDPNTWDVQLGVAALLKAVGKKLPEVAARQNVRETTPPKEVVDEQAATKTRDATTKERTAIKGAAAGEAGTAGTKAVVETPSTPEGSVVKHVTMAYLVPLGIAIFAAVLLVAVISYFKKHARATAEAVVETNAKWR